MERDEDDRLKAFAQLEQIHSKYTGTGHPSISRHEWAVHQHRDSYASYVAHKPLLSYIAISQNESLERTRYTMIQKMIQPCGPKPTENLFDKIKNDPERMKKAEEMVNKTK